MRKPALVVSDLDGTLMEANTAGLEPRTLAAIQRLLDAGIPFMPASGRQYPNVRNMLSSLRGDLSYVCENGVVAYMGGELVYRAMLDHGLGIEIIRAIQEREGCKPMVSGVETYYIEQRSPSFEQYLVEGCGFTVTCPDDLLDIGEPYGKISAFYADSVKDDLRYWTERFGSRCSVTTSGDKWIDIMPMGVNKAVALRAVLKQMGIDPRDVIAFGDARNDVEMLKLVGCPIAKADGAPEAIAQARYTTDDVASSLASILEGSGFDW